MDRGRVKSVYSTSTFVTLTRAPMYKEMTCGLRLGPSRVVVARTEEKTDRQNGASLHKQESVESFRTALGALEVLWVTHANACILRHCARVNVTANNLGASHLPDKTRC
jgi:hypothetical protein